TGSARPRSPGPPTASRSWPRWRTAPCGPRSSTRRNPATSARIYWPTGSTRSRTGRPQNPEAVRARLTAAARPHIRSRPPLAEAPAVMTTLDPPPAVDVRDGQAVRLVHGESGSETSYGDPLAAALAWQEAGAQWLHLVDLDAAF